MRTEPPPTPAPPWRPETFVDELCRHLVTAERFLVLGVVEDGRVRAHGVTAGGLAWPVADTRVAALAPLARLFDRVLVRGDGSSLEVLCLQDRLTRPDRRTTATLEELRAVGAEWLRELGVRPGTWLPLRVRLCEVGAARDRGHLADLRLDPARGPVGVVAVTLDPATAHVWTNAPPLARLPVISLVRRATRAVQRGEAAAPEAPVGMGYARPLLTYALLAALASVFLLQVTLGPGGGRLDFTASALRASGGLARDLVREGDWYRLASATLLHAGPVHLLMNAIALYFGGVLLEGLVGRAWLLTLYGLSALGGSVASLLLNPPAVVSVGASGAILGLFGAALAVSFRLPYGHGRTRMRVGAIQVLVPGIVPVFLARSGGIDFGAHLGGAAVGFGLGALLVARWPRSDAQPPCRRLARMVAAACALVLAGGLALALARRSTSAAREQGRSARFAPEPLIHRLPEGDLELEQAAAALLMQYPRDPRLLFYTARGALRAGDPSRAEAHLRLALEDPEALRRYLVQGERLEALLRANLGLLLLGRHARDDARDVLRPSCAVLRADPEAARGLDPGLLAAACAD